MRKVREIFRALGLDNKYSKETILGSVPEYHPADRHCPRHGGRLAGILRQARGGSDALRVRRAGLHHEEPTKYNPATNPEQLTTRRNHVLYEMYTQGYVTEAEYNAAKAETITLVTGSAMAENATRSSSNSWFTDALYTQLLTSCRPI